MRVLVTGSRFFTSLPTVRQALEEVTAGHQGPHVLVHGGARGADTLAAMAARKLGWAVEEFAADWDAPCRPACKPDHRRTRDGGGKYCPSAGVYRNADMVATDPDVVVAFYQRGARNAGTSHCVKLAGQAGLTVKRVTS